MTQKSISLGAALMMLLLALLWGGSFVAIRAALGEIGTFTTVALRLSLAAILLWAYVLALGLPLPRARDAFLPLLFVGVLNNAVPFSLITWGQNEIPSGLAAILNSTTALFSVGVAALFFADERLTHRRAIGVILGFTGVVVVIGAKALLGLDLTSLSQLAVLGATFCYALSGVFIRKRLRAIGPEVAAAGMLSASAVLILPIALLTEGFPSFAYAASTWAGILYLAGPATAVTSVLLYRVLPMVGVGNMSLVTLLIVPVAVLLGSLLYDETLAPRVFLGFGLLAAGLLVIDGRPMKILAKFLVKFFRQPDRTA